MEPSTFLIVQFHIVHFDSQYKYYSDLTGLKMKSSGSSGTSRGPSSHSLIGTQTFA